MPRPPERTPPYRIPQSGPQPGDDALPEHEPFGEAVCPRCHGTGRLDATPCPDCRGSGHVTVPLDEA
ncbi:MAG: hypothetical protein VW600_20430 [Ferrovibrio sp.]